MDVFCILKGATLDAARPVNLSIKNAPDELRRASQRNVRSEITARCVARFWLSSKVAVRPSVVPRMTPREVLERGRSLGLKTSSSVEIIRKMRDERYGG